MRRSARTQHNRNSCYSLRKNTYAIVSRISQKTAKITKGDIIQQHIDTQSV